MGGQKTKNRPLLSRIAAVGTQEQVAELAGISPYTLSKWVNCKSSPSGPKASKLARVLGCDLAVIIEGRD